MLADLQGCYRSEEHRSSKWPAVEKDHLLKEPCCQVCGTKHGLQVHHVVPFHVRPDLELDEGNLITLCGSHHLLFGHLMLWASVNEKCREDVAEWYDKIHHRPKLKGQNMALQTLDPTTKAAFTGAGITLTPAQEHVAAEAKTPSGAAVDWPTLLKNLAAELIPIVLAFFGINLPPATKAAAGCCDHRCCCQKTFEAAICTAKLAGEHLAECCC